MAHLPNSTEALGLKCRVSHRQHLIDNENLRFQVGGNSKGKADGHAAAVALDGHLDKVLDISEGHDLIKLASDLATAHSEDAAVHIDVFAAGQLGVKTRADF